MKKHYDTINLSTENIFKGEIMIVLFRVCDVNFLSTYVDLATHLQSRLRYAEVTRTS